MPWPRLSDAYDVLGRFHLSAVSSATLCILGWSLQNPHVLKAGAQEDRGMHAKMSSIIGAQAVADLVKTTLGPKGMVRSLLLSGLIGGVWG